MKKWAADDLETELALQSQLGRDLNDIEGRRGYGRADEREGTGDGDTARMFGTSEQEKALATTWRGGRHECVQGQIIP